MGFTSRVQRLFNQMIQANANDIGGDDIDLTGDIEAASLTVTGAVSADTVSATSGLSGDLSGNVTGNVTGDLSGNVTGNVTGDVTGDVTGNLYGQLIATGSKARPVSEPKNMVTAQGTFTLTGLPTEPDYVEVDGTKYEFLPYRTGAGSVLLGASNLECAANFAAAVNEDSATVTATDNLDGTVTIEAVTPGVGGDAITFTEGAANTTVDGAGTLGATRAGAAAVAAEGTITLGGVPVAEETFTIGGTTYTWKALRNSAHEVTIGVDANACATNIETAMGLDQTDVLGVAGVGAVVCTAAVAGAAGNALTFTESCTNMSMDGGGVLGGTQAGVDAIASQGTVTFAGLPTAAESLLVGDHYYYFRDARVNPFEIAVGAGAPATVTNIVNAINTDDGTMFDASDGAGDTVVVEAKDASIDGALGNAVPFDFFATNITADGTDYLGGTRSGVDGSDGDDGEIRVGNSYLYVCVGDNDRSGANWRRVSLGSAY